jgi:prepilin-type N-terminal cleavage/methylation domain-containing protein
VADASRCRGFSLVESLVAMLLVATALLGVAGLQLASLRGGAHALDLLGAQDHVASRAESLRALHGIPGADRTALLGRGEARSCRGARRCTPLEFASDEAARSGAAAVGRGWVVTPTVIDAEADPLRATFELRRDDRRLVLLGIES